MAQEHVDIYEVARQIVVTFDSGKQKEVMLPAIKTAKGVMVRVKNIGKLLGIVKPDEEGVMIDQRNVLGVKSFESFDLFCTGSRWVIL
jgi:hypothetical protein